MHCRGVQCRDMLLLFFIISTIEVAITRAPYDQNYWNLVLINQPLIRLIFVPHERAALPAIFVTLVFLAQTVAIAIMPPVAPTSAQKKAPAKPRRRRIILKRVTRSHEEVPHDVEVQASEGHAILPNERHLPDFRQAAAAHPFDGCKAGRWRAHDKLRGAVVFPHVLCKRLYRRLKRAHYEQRNAAQRQYWRQLSLPKNCVVSAYIDLGKPGPWEFAAAVNAAYCHSRGCSKKRQVCGLDVDAAAVVQHDADACSGGVEAGTNDSG